MNTTAASNLRDAAKDAREGVREVRQAAAEASAEMRDDLMHDDLQKLREDFHRLADQVAEIVGNRGSAAWRRAKSTVDDAFAEAQDKGRDAASAVREVSDNFVDAIDESIKTRPYTTLALVAGIAFLFGATWRR
jgi:ElaB/YqjD/DUF883 family membrane-anchored ribosome-binding protein